MRLIDADAFKSFLCKCCNILHSEEPCEPSDCNVLAVIDEQPTVDAVEVVRCKDCVYYREEDLLCVGVSCVGDSHANWYPEDFCSYGERKDNG